MKEQPVEEGASRRKRLGRSVFILPSLLTVGNIFFGYYAILACMRDHNFILASQYIGIAIILDCLDGFVARLTNSSSGFGLQLDSLADVISFGIAPSVLALVWGLSATEKGLALVAAFTFAICGAMRLARFNIQAGNLKHFVGLPIPGGGGAIAAIVYFFKDPITSPIYSHIMVAVVFLFSFLMISTIRYPSLKHLVLRKKSHLTILVIALLIASIVIYSEWTLLILAMAYGISGLVVRLYSAVRRKKPIEEMKLVDSVHHQ
jgi:CDP-diacylglycerol---serine O-phosphatidyltransferase